MSLHYIIDGYNLIRHRDYQPYAKGSDQQKGLLDFLRDKKPFGSSRNKVTVVFDGYGGLHGLRDPDFEIIFSCDVSADQRIKEMVSRRGAGRSTVVVSDDREIRDFTKVSQVSVMSVSEFVGKTRIPSSARKGSEDAKDVSFTQMLAINEELRKRWLKE